MINVKKLTKVFRQKGKGFKAVDNVSFDAREGEIFGLLGPNGAGKTTILRSIATLISPSQGDITVNGLDVQKNSRQVRDMIGFLTSDMKLSGNLTARELMFFFGELNHMSRGDIKKRVDYLAEYLDMTEYLDKTIEKCSTGMKQKAAIAISLIHDPEVILFDEPTAGLDILASKIVIDFLRDFKARGKVVILSTHIMSEAQTLCDRVGILLKGELAVYGEIDAITTAKGFQTIEDLFFFLAQERGMLKNV